METLYTRLRITLADHFGEAHVMAIDPDDDLYRDAQPGSGLGDDTDRVEMAVCILREYGVQIPLAALRGPVTIAGLEALISTLVASRDASAH